MNVIGLLQILFSPFVPFCTHRHFWILEYFRSNHYQTKIAVLDVAFDAVNSSFQVVDRSDNFSGSGDVITIKSRKINTCHLRRVEFFSQLGSRDASDTKIVR